jgi:hypothetical protein
MRRSALIVASCRQLLRAAESNGTEALAGQIASGSAASCTRIANCTAEATFAAAGRRSLHRWAHPQLPGQRNAALREVQPHAVAVCHSLPTTHVVPCFLVQQSPWAQSS